jgi:hypothetical protein
MYRLASLAAIPLSLLITVLRLTFLATGPCPPGDGC